MTAVLLRSNRKGGKLVCTDYFSLQSLGKTHNCMQIIEYSFSFAMETA